MREHLRAPAPEEPVQGLRRAGLLRAPAHPCKDCKKQAQMSSAQSGRPRDAGGKRGAWEAGIEEAGSANQPRPH
jgi:hypothetical protein